MQKSRSSEAAQSLTAARGLAADASARPLRELVHDLQRLPRDSSGAPAFQAAEAELLDRVAHNAETAMRAIHLGLGGLGQLLARCAVDIESGRVPADCLANVGFLMAELGDLAAECLCLAAQCRCATSSTRPEAADANRV